MSRHPEEAPRSGGVLVVGLTKTDRPSRSPTARRLEPGATVGLRAGPIVAWAAEPSPLG